ncbi:MAG: formylglycine-generating enzyme family protein [Kiritimatiellae bacterium]|nr:formylglycine-generating enzyme family protein [Kiritimatiellia bacterium]
MKTKTIRTVLASLAGCLTLGAMAADPTISDVVVRQRWPWSRLVDIDYVLTGEVGAKADVTIKGYDGQTALNLPLNAFSGDCYGVTPGFRKIVFDPFKTGYTNSPMTRFRVEISITNTPLYMVVDLTKSAGQEGQIEYVYPGDARLVTEGRYTNLWADVTNDVYKTDKLVLRHVSSGTFMMGSPDSELGRVSANENQHQVTLTHDYFIAIYQMTQKQWEHITGTAPSCFWAGSSRPRDSVSYDNLRGVGCNWWASNSVVAAGSFLYKLRSVTGIDDFDLPTDAQFEYACRAGTTTALNNGTDLTNTVSDANLNLLGRYAGSGGATGGTAVVGSYLPNDWGVYDMHGNLWELCLDLFTAGLGTTPVTDPVGAKSGGPVTRTGRWANDAYWCRSACRNFTSTSDNSANIGFRVVRTLR